MSDVAYGEEDHMIRSRGKVRVRRTSFECRSTSDEAADVAGLGSAYV